MATRGARLPLGSAAWISEERTSALHISEQEVEEFSFSARNDFEWLNEHMSAIFDDNEIDVASIFKTPLKLRAVKTPRSNKTQEAATTITTAKATEVASEPIARAASPVAEKPVSDAHISTTPAGTPSGRFAQKLTHRSNSPTIALVQPNADLDDERDVSPTPARSSTPSLSKPINTTDSGYYGSHSQTMDTDITTSPNSRIPLATKSRSAAPSPRPNQRRPLSPELREAPTSIPQPTSRGTSPRPTRAASPRPTRATSPMGMPASPRARSVIPLASSPLRSSPLQSFHGHSESIAQKLHNNTLDNDKNADVQMGEDEANESETPEDDEEEEEDDEDEDDDARSGSLSPVRPVMRKSSLNFATLPAREPLSHKSSGARASRTSNLEMLRSSYYPRTTSGKSLGASLNDDDNENNEMQIDEKPDNKPAEDPTTHSMSYTQRLQDQINKLVESQPKAARPSKSFHGLAGLGQTQPASQAPIKSTASIASPVRNAAPAPVSTTPGAFPRDDDEDWVDPPVDGNFFSPSPPMESMGRDFGVPKHRALDRLENTLGHGKSSSISVVSEAADVNHVKTSHAKSISVSTSSLTHLPPESGGSVSPIKSPTRVARESPLKHVKNKLSSILKGSKGLLATNATVGADGKSVVSPSARLEGADMESTESLHAHPATTSSESLYPEISAQASEAQSSTSSRALRISAEREKSENEARIQAEMEKADRARELEREQALRALNEEKEREREREKQRERARIREQEVAAQRERERELEREHEREREREREHERELERQREAERERELEREREREREVEREREQQQQQQQQQRQWELEKEREREREKALAAKRGPTPTGVERPKSRTALASPKKIMRPRQQTADDDAMDIDTPARSTASVARPTTSHGLRTKEIKRPTKPVAAKSRPEPPKHIVVKPTSMYHPSTAALSSTLQDTLDPSGPNSRPQSQLSMKSSQGSLKEKDTSSNSLKSSAASSAGGSSRSRAAELAARKREQDEKRRKEVKADMERKRMTPNDETRRLEQRRMEAERIKEEELKAMEAKKKAQRQAAIERAKQTRAPPPAVRSQPNGPPDYSQSAIVRPQSRMAIATAANGSEITRPKSAMKGSVQASKRQLDEEKNMMQSRSGPSYQAAKDSKRRRTGDELDEDEFDVQQSALKGPPVRPSSALKKDHPTKSGYGAGASSAYGQSATTPGTTRDVFKNSTTKNPGVDMSQFSKGTIPFASSSATASGQPNTMDPSLIFGPPAPLNMEEVFNKNKERWSKFRARTSSANWAGADKLTEEDIRKDMAARDKIRRDGGWTYDLSRDMAPN
ncbi:hypothetical protein TD95_000683 [Thielaviopsis punctulata]|uniref:Inner centromere protein ARK-binding domain-containing protein n=1 Tax=Thielaviopsis punctulata TaxID=72032 RepID=A0A0F4ZHM2_9PEZI|nr:hypothetical protein TD95_000683 [Thielaviopsis punctulata]